MKAPRPVLLGGLFFSLASNCYLLLALVVRQHLAACVCSGRATSSGLVAGPHAEPASLPRFSRVGGGLPGELADLDKRRVVVVLARHDEDLSFVSRQALGELAHVQLKVYQALGNESVEAVTDAAARRAAAEPPQLAAAEVERAGEAGLAVRAVPLNRGREAMAYLTAMLDHYDDPSVSTLVFMHGHAEPKHSHFLRNWIVRWLDHRPPGTLADGYASLSCKSDVDDQWNRLNLLNISATPVDPLWAPGFKQWHLPNLLTAWEEHFAGWLGPVPEVLQSPAHAEFAVSRPALRSRPRAFYEATRHWLMTSRLDSYRAGLVLEYLWAFVFTGRPTYWAPQERCLCELYGLCLPARRPVDGASEPGPGPAAGSDSFAGSAAGRW